MRVLACNSPFGQGGLGQHFAQLVEESREAQQLHQYFAPEVPTNDPRATSLTVSTYGLLRYTPLRYSVRGRTYVLSELFDWTMARHLPADATRYMGFVGESLRTFRRAKRLGYDQLELVAANSHVDNVLRLHEQAAQAHGIRDSWLGTLLARKTRQEYEQADLIYVHSDYTRQSFIDAGIPASKLRRTVLTVDPRFVPPKERPSDGVFRIVYVGRIEATKGIPLLLDTLHQLPFDAELTLVGRWGTRTMRRYMEDWCRREPRICVSPGDPLPALQKADVFVHPSYEDGFGYAPMEALACGVPVIVTSDTGMKEYVKEGVNGYVIPTGDGEALRDRLVHLHRNPLARVRSARTASPQ